MLIDAAEQGPTWRGMSGPNRTTLYKVAAGTGFRVSELRSLRPSSFQLDNDPPSLFLRATHSKHRRNDVQPIRADLAELLRCWLADRPNDSPVFADMPGKTALMLKADMRLARARWIRATSCRAERRQRRHSDCLAVVDRDGRTVDFHSLRATFIMLLVKSGASVKEAQELARHCDPRLTLNVYTRLGVNDLAGALDRLPGVADDDDNAERLRATGTCDVRPSSPFEPHPYARQLGRQTVRTPATRCKDAAARHRSSVGRAAVL